MTIGVFLTYRVLDIADLTAEGSIVTGAAAAAVIIAGGGNPFAASLAAFLAGAATGLITGLLHTKLKIPALLSGILCMIALYSINIRIMKGAANVSLLRKTTVYTEVLRLLPSAANKDMAAIAAGLLCAAAVCAAVYWFFGTELGSAIRAAGDNMKMARSQGINTDNMIIMGLALSNALIGLSGGLIAQYLGFADVSMGIGSIVIGLASVIIGEVLFGVKTFRRTLFSLVCGSVVYRIVIAFVYKLGMPASDLKLFTAMTVAAALYLPKLTKKWAKRAKGGGGNAVG
jgi:putative ABC transport system permease protein